jgi:phage baseplate assembly protein gpV
VLQIWVLTWLFWKSRRAADPKFWYTPDLFL